MKLFIYKGFSNEFLSTIKIKPLVENKIEEKKDVFSFDKKTKKLLDLALLSLEEDDSVWMTYEEYTLVKTRIEESIAEDNLEVTIYKNNLFPEYYPIEIPIDNNTAIEIENVLSGDVTIDMSSDQCKSFLLIYNSLIRINDSFFGSFYNYEYDINLPINQHNYYPNNLDIDDSITNGDYNILLNEDIDTYLRNLTTIENIKPNTIGVRTTNGFCSKRMLLSLKAYCIFNKIKLVDFQEILPENKQMEDELINIAKNNIGIQGFSEFRKIKFYKNPDLNKDIIELSQGQIIQEIIHQAQNAYKDTTATHYRDVFITASTGAGKSVMFQIPAVYLAKKYNKLTIIIEPVKALMQDQKEKLIKNGYDRVEAFNSDLITQVEKEAVLDRIKNGEIDLLYLSPETLLSYSIETIIGDREIGLVIVDEAHIVTTWGVGFRPDYWYLGNYLNRLRNQIQTSKGMKRKTYKFPICAFTATAINGGIDDTVSDTIISLYMENPVKYIGYVRRDDIHFDITHQAEYSKLPKSEYEERKTKVLNDRIHKWISNNEKTIVYFPYATLAGDAAKGIRGFAGITTDKRIGTYTGKNINAVNIETFNEEKRQMFENFRNGKTPIMFATKAFGMGVDVDDVQNVYHYAVTGTLCDYVQEIGRAARKSTIDGLAITDNFYNDISFMKSLFGMSQIKQYQIKAVLQGIYDTYKSKKYNRSFLISPQSFTYIFNGKGVTDEDKCINKLKTCLLMLEKDFYDKYNFKVIISRPQSVFTKAFVCVTREKEKNVLSSKYGKYFKFIEKGRFKEKQPDGTLLSDVGDIYSIDLKEIWEEFYSKISFPQFKYWYFNSNSNSKDKVEIMPQIREFIAPRQKITIDASGDMLLSDLRPSILEDFEYIANSLYTSFGKNYFTTEDFTKMLRDRFGITKARIIANSLFDLVDPNSTCVKKRTNEKSGKTYYILSNGNFKEYLRKTIIKSRIMNKISMITDNSAYYGFVNLSADEMSMIALKLLSIFDYITYEVAGGEEPEIFIRLNDPNKVKSIVMGNTFYSNNYVTKAKHKHERDVELLLNFFNNLKNDNERWNYIEDYFLGYDVLSTIDATNENSEKMIKFIDKEHSYPTSMFNGWADLKSFFDENDHLIIEKLICCDIPIPEYLETELKKTDNGNDILMSWPSKDTLICQQDTSDSVLRFYKTMGWNAYRIYNIDYEKIKKYLS